MACVRSTVGFHPARTPSSVTNKNAEGPDLQGVGLQGAGCVTTKPVEPLKTIPVGLLDVLPAAGGLATTSDCVTPAPSYSVETPVPLSATHAKPKGLKAIP